MMCTTAITLAPSITRAEHGINLVLPLNVVSIGRHPSSSAMVIALVEIVFRLCV